MTEVAAFTVELLLLALLFSLLAVGILNDLPARIDKLCRCDNIGRVSLILLGCELRVLSLYYVYKAS